MVGKKKPVAKVSLAKSKKTVNKGKKKSPKLKHERKLTGTAYSKRLKEEQKIKAKESKEK